MKRRKLLVFTALFCTLAGCAEADYGSEAAPSKAPPAAASAAATAGPAEDAPLDASGTSAQIPAQRKLIQNAELHVEVSSYASARSELDALLGEHGGFVADAEVHHVDGEVGRAELTLRIPSDRLATFLKGASGQGKVLHEKLSSEDITDGYFDMKARLDNAKRLEGRLLAIMNGEAKSMKDSLEVERELARVREEIERYEGKLRLWDKQVALSTVHLSLVTKKAYVAQTPPTLAERAEATLASSFGALAGLGKGLLLLVTLLVPWILPLALILFGVRALVRRIRRRQVVGSAGQTPLGAERLTNSPT